MIEANNQSQYLILDHYSYMKRLIKIIKHKEETEEDIYARWEKDFDLVPNSVHGLFYEYLELGARSMCTIRVDACIHVHICTCVLCTCIYIGHLFLCVQ